eukprot:3693428-Heterocapsa_arctica.AAC.1
MAFKKCTAYPQPARIPLLAGIPSVLVHLDNYGFPIHPKCKGYNALIASSGNSSVSCHIMLNSLITCAAVNVSSHKMPLLPSGKFSPGSNFPDH